jgi:hypothetical protein
MTGERVEVLERQVTLLQARLGVLVALAALLPLGLGYALQQQASPVVEARMFVLQGADGKPAAILRVTAEPGRPSEGAVRGVLARTEMLTVTDGDGRLLATVGPEGVGERP